MCVIQISPFELGKRGQKIRHLLQPLSKQPVGPAWKTISRSGQYIIGVHDGSPPQSDFTEWRFATLVHNLQGAYYEIWIRLSDESWYLRQAYLSMHRTDRTSASNTVKFIALHCDPNEPDEASHAIYKKGPHLHIQAADDPIPRAHIALCVGHLNDVLSSVDYLSEAMGLAVRMLREEVLDIMI